MPKEMQHREQPSPSPALLIATLEQLQRSKDLVRVCDRLACVCVCLCVQRVQRSGILSVCFLTFLLTLLLLFFGGFCGFFLLWCAHDGEYF